MGMEQLEKHAPISEHAATGGACSNWWGMQQTVGMQQLVDMHHVVGMHQVVGRRGKSQTCRNVTCLQHGFFMVRRDILR
jgi:hypothetical protein